MINMMWMQVLLINVEDRMGDVRELSGNILKLFNPEIDILHSVHSRKFFFINYFHFSFSVHDDHDLFLLLVS